MDLSNQVSQLDVNVTDETLAKLEKLAALQHAVAETKKLEAEAEKLKIEEMNIRHAESDSARRFWIPMLAPLLTALAVALGLGLQVWQVNVNSALQRQSNNDAQFREAIKMAGSDNSLQSIAGASLIQKFLSSGDYKDQARQIEIGVLSTSKRLDTFNIFFSTISDNVTWANYRSIVTISQGITGIWLKNYNQLLELRQQSNPDNDTKQQIASLDKENAQVLEEIRETNLVLVALLRSGHSADIKPDLTGVMFSAIDMSHVDSKGAVVNSTQFEDCILTDADFSLVSKFSGSDWTGSNWWRAKNISPALLKFLETSYPYSPGKSYYGDTTRNQQEYNDQVKRLEDIAEP